MFVYNFLNSYNYPNRIFLISSVLLYVQYYIYDVILKSVSNKYYKLDNLKQKYVVSNLLKCNTLLWLILFMFPLFLQPFREEWPITAWKHASAIYASSDLVSLIMVKKHHLSTILHHVFSVFINLSAVNFGTFDTPNLWQALMYYGIYSSIAYLVNGFLSIRFLLEKDSKILYYLCLYSSYIYIIGCTINWSTQMYYFIFYLPVSITSTIYFTSLINFIRDDLKLIRFQIRYTNNFNK